MNHMHLIVIAGLIGDGGPRFLGNQTFVFNATSISQSMLDKAWATLRYAAGTGAGKFERPSLYLEPGDPSGIHHAFEGFRLPQFDRTGNTFSKTLDEDETLEDLHALKATRIS